MVVGMPHMKNFGHVIASKSLEVTMHTAMLVGNKEEISCTPNDYVCRHLGDF